VSRDWAVSNALDKLEPVFRDREMTQEEIHEVAALCGVPIPDLWKAEHLYQEIRRICGGDG